ncbi:MAG TPA: ATP-binding protein [Candidatus Polarisedimenticolia bacterium]|nr:ATP-binding protein [Candidatus Polarisedimenticolia bacterium]
MSREGAEESLSAVHARFARAVLLIYLGAAGVAVGLLITALATDLSYQRDVARETLLLETQVRAYYLGRHLHLLAGELTRLGLRSEVNLLDQNVEPERSLLRLSHEKSAVFNVGVAVVNQEGVTVWSEPQNFLPSGVSLGRESWFQMVLRTRNVLIVPVRPEREKDSLLYVVSPILRGGQFAGVLIGGIDLALEGPLGTEFHPGAHSLDVLATRGGVVVFPPKPPPFSSVPDWTSLLHRSSDEPFIAEARLLDGARTVIAGAPVQGTDFLLLALADADLFFGPARARLITRLGLGLTLALLPGGLLIVLLRRSFREFERSEQKALRGERLRLLGEAVNLIAHEVKNSLNGMRVGLDMILQGDRTGLEARHRQAVSGLRTEMERLSDFTTELLSFSKGVIPRPATIDLVEFARKVTDLARPRAEGLGVVLDLVARDGRVNVRADPTLIHVILANLIGNALDALSVAHVPRPLVTVRVEPPHDAVARVRVSDNGPGVPAGLRPRLFEPFVTGKPSGVGIGLAQSRKIARAHGGDLVLEGPGPGASFLLTLPLEVT